MSWCRARLFTAALIVLSLSQFTPLASLIPATIPLGPSAASAASNPIQVENSQPGTTAWQIDTNPNTGDPLLAQNHEIEGYASLTSVNAGGSISFMVSLSTAAQYTLNIYRMGYYGGAGGRLMQSVPAANGTTQATCPRVTITTNFGLTECAWTPSYTLSVPSNWTTGDYIVKLKRLDSGLESYIPFTVRDDGAPADIVLSNDVTTWQAYNFWGGSRNNNIGYSLYGEFYDNGDNNFENIGNAHANAVSFNRPYAVAGETDGAGQFFIWDYPMVRWLESKGYNVTYATDIDIENNPTLLAGRKAFINTGHDEYYSATMRSNLLGYISGGAHAGFFSANNIYYQIRFANDAAGNPDRTIICYKNSSLDPTTIQWRYLNPPQPENAIIGVLQNGVANDRPWVVADASSWIFAGTGLANGQSIPSLVGYEFDERAANDSSLSSFVPYEPAGLQQVAHSPVPASDNGVAAYSDATLYTAASGAIVFAAGTMQWSWGLDAGYLSPGCGGCNGYAPNAKARLITSNILNKFLGTTPTPTPAVGLNPSTLAFGSQPVGTTSGAQAVTLTNAGSAALAISSIRLSGTNASDFAQTNTCPLSPSTLAAGASCRISVTFTPAAGASRSASVTIADNAPGSPHNVALTGTGTSTTAPVVSLSPSTLAFGNQVVTTATAAQLVTLANTGNAALTISSIGLTGPNPGDFAETTTCGGSLAAGASCTISVRFTPTTSGSRSANLSIADDAAGSPHLVALTGTGTLPAGEYLVDGFESGSLSAWGVFNGGGTTAATTTVVNSGAYAAVLTNAANGQYAGIYADLVGGPRAQSYTRFCFQIPASGGTTVLAQGRNVNGNTLWEIDYDQPRHGLDLYFWNTASPPSRYDLYSNANLIVQGHWYCAEVLVNETSSGQGQVWLNGTSLGTVTGDLSAANPYSRLILFNNAYIGDAHFDDVLVSASYSAPVGAGSAPLPIPVVSLSPASLTFADQVLNSTSAAQTVTLTNSGAAPLTISSIGVTGSNPGDFAQTTNCGSSLAAGASCSISVTFTPTAAGSRTARLTLVDNAGGSPQSVALAGSGTAATLSLSTPNLAFGTQPNGTPSAAQTVTVTNSGAAALTISSLGFSGADPGDFAQTTTCPLSPSTLGAGASCRISVTFVPTAAGSRSATLTLTDNAADSPQSVALSGSGSPAGAYLVDGFESGTLNAWTIFNGGGTATIETSTVNSGSYAAALTTTASGQLAGLFADLAGDAPAQSDTRFCFNLHGIGSSIVLAQGRDGNGANRWELDYDAGRQGLDGYFWNGAGTRVDLYSAANLLTADRWYCVELLVNETSSGQAQVWLNGTSLGTVNGDLSSPTPMSRLYLWNNAAVGTVYVDDVAVTDSYSGPVGAGAIPLPAPGIGLSSTSLNFGSQPTNRASAAQTVTLTNTGNRPLTITGITLAGTNAGDFAQTNTCPTSPSTLAAGANCTLSVTFTPTASGSRSGTLSIADNASGSPQTVALSGTGTTATAALSPSGLAFGSQQPGTQSSAQTVTLTNTGSAPLAIASIAITGSNPADFAQTNTCPSGPNTLAVGTSCTIRVTFAPTTSGSRSATLSINDDTVTSPQQVSLTGTGGSSGIYLVDGFESGGLRAWTIFNGGGTAVVQTSTVNSGSYAAALTTTASGQLAGLFADLAGDAPAQSDTRFCFNLHGIGSSIVLAQGRDGNGANRWELDYDAGRQGLDGYFWNGAGTRVDFYSAANLLTADRWYCVELLVNETSSGQAQVWLNGTSLGTVTGDLSASTPYHRLYLWNNAAVGTVYFDDVAVSASP